MYRCKQCSSTNVQVAISYAWLEQDEDGDMSYVPDIDWSEIDKSNGWCKDCEENTGVEEVDE